MDKMEKYFGKKVSTKPETKLAAYARYEIRALKSSLQQQEIKRLRCYITQDLELYRNIYRMICLHANVERALGLIRLCAPIVYSSKNIRTMTSACETWKKTVLMIDYGYDDIDYSTDRLYFSALELLFMRATPYELRAVIAFLVDDTKNLVEFTVSDWVFRKPTLN